MCVGARTELCESGAQRAMRFVSVIRVLIRENVITGRGVYLRESDFDPGNFERNEPRASIISGICMRVVR